MNSLAKQVVLPAVFTALLIGSQFVLSWVSGVEIVTVLLLSFAYKYGIRQGLLVANAFSLLRCFIYGFMPNVLVLYLVYYNLFVLAIGAIGNAFGHGYSIKKHAVLVGVALFLTVSFTMLDNVLTPLMFRFSLGAAKAYFFASLYTMIPQIICTLATVTFMFPVLIKVLK